MIVKSVSLHCDKIDSDGTVHDKVYHMQLVEVGPNEYLLQVQYGKRGGKLQFDTKNAKTLSSRWRGEQEFDKKMKSQIEKKGYHVIPDDPSVLMMVSMMM